MGQIKTFGVRLDSDQVACLRIKFGGKRVSYAVGLAIDEMLERRGWKKPARPLPAPAKAAAPRLSYEPKSRLMAGR